MVVREVQREHALRLEVPEVKAHGLDREQVRRDGIPEVHQQQIIPLVGLTLERQACIPGYELRSRRLPPSVK